jgi:hypothetical protein
MAAGALVNAEMSSSCLTIFDSFHSSGCAEQHSAGDRQGGALLVYCYSLEIIKYLKGQWKPWRLQTVAFYAKNVYTN